MSNKFTSDDLKALYELANKTSVIKIRLKQDNFDPQKFEEILKFFPEEYDFVFNEPYEDLPLRIDDPKIEGYLRWRLSIGK